MFRQLIWGLGIGRRRIPVLAHDRHAYEVLSRPGLLWTEYLYLAIIGLVAFIVANPFSLPFRQAGLTKHVGLVLTVPLLVLHFLARAVGRSQQDDKFSEFLARAWPLLAMAIMVVLGSVYASRVDKISNNFLSMGMYIPIFAFSGYVLLTTTAPQRFLKIYFAIWAMSSATMAALVVVTVGKVKVYHEEIFLIVPMAVFFVLMPWPKLICWAAGLAFLAIGVLSRKNTSHLVGLLTLLYFLLAVWLPLRREGRDRRIFAFLKGYVATCALLAMVAGTVFLILHKEQYLPSGNSEYRLHTYRLALNKFLDSPIWGTGFTESSSHRFSLYHVATGTQVLPVHSDIMDILAHGGMIGIFFWAFGLWKIASIAYRRLLQPRLLTSWWTPYAHTLALSSLCALVVYAFNPVITSIPALAYLLWTNLGLLLGLALRVQTESTKPSRDGFGT